MNLRRIRLQLTVLYGLLAALAVGSLTAYAISIGRDRIFDGAERDGVLTASQVVRAPDPEALDLDNTWLVNVTDKWEKPVGESWIEPPLFTVAAQALPDNDNVFQPYTQDGGEFLIHAGPYDENTAVLTGVDLGGYQDESNALTLRLVLAGIAVTALATALSWWAAGRSLRPARVALDNQRDFVADAAHEMRTPLAVIQASASHALNRDREPGEYRQSLEEIRGAATRATAGVGELLELARLDAGQAQPRLAPLRIDLLAEEVASSVIVEGVTVEAVTPPGPVVVEADYLLLRQAVENIVRNAAARGDRVTISLDVEARHGVIRVADDGPGFDPEMLPTVFERFRRGDTKGGAGLGLAIARSIVELHHGSIRAENSPSGGAVVIIELALTN